MLHPGALAQKAFKKQVYLFFWKLLGWHRKYIFHVTDNKEQEFVVRTFGNATTVAIAGNFPLMRSRLQVHQKEQGVLKMITVALISPMKNYLMVLEALEAIGNGQLAISNKGTQQTELYYLFK